MCDWFVAMVGGYGAAPTCVDGFISAPPDKPECVATFPTCAVTVGSLQDCMQMIIDRPGGVHGGFTGRGDGKRQLPVGWRRRLLQLSA